MQHRAIFVLMSIVVLVAGIYAQTPANPQQKAEPASRFVSTSQLVVVPVVLTDKHGKHISGLGKQDFQVLEDGKARNIAIFEEVHATGIPPKERAKKSVEDISNFSVDDDRPRRLNIIVMDLVNTPFTLQARARAELISFLSQSLQADQPTALLVIGRDGVKQIHGFTTDTRVLIAALKKVRGGLSPMEQADSSMDQSLENDVEFAEEVSALEQLDSKMNGIYSDFQQRDAIRITMRSMEQIAQAYAGIPGRKTMIWSTTGFPFLLDDPHMIGSLGTDMISTYERAWQALNTANIAIYPVNSAGLENSIYEQNYSVTMRAPRSPRGNYQRMGSDRYRQRMDALHSFADATGGKACLDRNDLGNCFKEATQDSEDYYLLGYYLPTDDRKPGWHKLKVRTSRDHVQIRARDGFLVPEAKAQDANNLRLELATALAAPLDYTGIHMDVRWVGVNAAKDQSGKRNAKFEVSMPAGAFIVDGGNNNRVELEIVAMAFGPDGKSVAETTRTVTGNLKADSVEKIRRGGFSYTDEIAVAPGTYKVKFMVRDNQNGKIGTVSAQLVAN